MISCMNTMTIGTRGYHYTSRGASGRKTLRYVDIIEGLNYNSSWSKPRDSKEITLFRQWKEKKRKGDHTKNTYQRRNILLYYCVFMIRTLIISISRID